jgi:hypothetical protein
VKLKIFISSVQKEFQQARKDLKAFLLGDAVLHRFISEVFLFEELPARDRRADEVYLEQVKRCDIYLGIFGYEYGYEDKERVSPTEREYDYAGKLGKIQLIYVWGADDKQRAERMKNLIRKAGSELIRRRVENTSALTAEVYASLVDYLDGKGALRVRPFDTSPCENATLHHLSRKRVAWFLDMVRKGVLEKVGITGKGTHYILSRKGLTKGSKSSCGERDIMGTMGTAIRLAPYASDIGISYAPRMPHMPKKYYPGLPGINGATKGPKGTRNRGMPMENKTKVVEGWRRTRPQVGFLMAPGYLEEDQP